MQLNYIAFAVPFFMLFIGWEYWYTRKKKKNFYQFAESVANLNVGIAERLTDIFTTGFFFYVFDYIQKHWGMFHIEAGPLTWFLLFLFTDLVWYWYHRFGHRVNLGWAVHVVHHQSDNFNFTVSARITIFQAAVRGVFWALLPLFGFPAVMVSAFLLVHGLYPFFTHTQTIGKLGWLEKIIVTPSHHGVHHASNPEYLDKNYGDMLIIWDKIFGTYAEEKNDVKPVYGLTKPLNSHSFLWQHFHFWLEMALNFRYARGFRARWNVIFGKPEDLDPRYRSVLEKKLSNIRPHATTTPVLRQYVTTQTIFSITLLFIVALFAKYFSVVQLFLIALFILVSLINSGAILDQRKWNFFLEFLRALIVMVGVALMFRNTWILGTITAIVIIGIWNFRPIQRKYIQFLYNR